MGRALLPVTGIPFEMWEATGIVLETSFTDILDGGSSSSSYLYTITGGSAFTTF